MIHPQQPLPSQQNYLNLLADYKAHHRVPSIGQADGAAPLVVAVLEREDHLRVAIRSHLGTRWWSPC